MRLPFAWHLRRLDEEDVAASGHPGQASGHARYLSSLGNLGEKLLRPQELGDLRRVEFGLIGFVFCHLDRDGADDIGHLAFQVAHAASRVYCSMIVVRLSSSKLICLSSSPCSAICLGTRWRLAISSFSSRV